MSNITTKTADTSRRAIVVGATSGMGAEVARLLAANGWSVGIAGRRLDRLQALASETAGIVMYRQIDVTAEDAGDTLRAFIDEMGGIDLYFHSSGIGKENLPLDIRQELATVATNGLGFTRMIDTAYNYFAETDAQRRRAGMAAGQIAAITSIARTKGLGASAAYSATKRFQGHYLECLTQLAHMRKLSIDITEIRPGFVATDFIAGSNYPLQLSTEAVARDIVKAVVRRKAVVTIDWRYALLVSVWRLVPRWLWVRLPIK